MKGAILSIVVGAVLAGCVTETPGDRELKEREDQEGPKSYDPPDEERTAEPDPFYMMAFDLKMAFHHAQVRPAEGPFVVVIDEAAKEIRVEKTDPDTVVNRYPIPDCLAFEDNPGPITFHRDGRVTWPRPDQTLQHRQTTACDITVRDKNDGWFCAYDLIWTPSGLQLEMMPISPEAIRNR